jgi:hypothetical protein
MILVKKVRANMVLECPQKVLPSGGGVGGEITKWRRRRKIRWCGCGTIAVADSILVCEEGLVAEVAFFPSKRSETDVRLKFQGTGTETSAFFALIFL